MKYVKIPGTDLKPASICMGGQPFVEGASEQTFGLLDKYVELGGNFIDTANVYGKKLPNRTNSSELTIGSWMKERKNRAGLIISTKGGHPEFTTMDKSRLSQDEVESDLNESLKGLQTEYVDLYLLHRDDEKIPVAIIMEYLTKFVKQGKIRYFGCSNWKPYRIREAIKYAQFRKIKGFVGNQALWSFAVVNENAFDDKTIVVMDDQGLRLHQETGLAAIPYSSQANGFFNKMAMQADLPLSQVIKRIYYNEENLRRFERVKQISVELSKSITEIILGYLVSQPFPTIPVVGCHTIEQLKDSMKAGDIVLNEKTIKYLQCGNESDRS